MVEGAPPPATSRALRRHRETMTRRHALHPAEQDVLAEVARQTGFERLRVGDGVEGIEVQKCLQLGREGEPPRADQDVQRFYPEAIAREKQGAVAAVPDGEAPHPVEAQQGVGSPPFERGEDHFGVAVAAKPKAIALQFVAQLEEVVDLAVVGDVVPATG